MSDKLDKSNIPKTKPRGLLQVNARKFSRNLNKYFIALLERKFDGVVITYHGAEMFVLKILAVEENHGRENKAAGRS